MIWLWLGVVLHKLIGLGSWLGVPNLILLIPGLVSFTGQFDSFLEAFCILLGYFRLLYGLQSVFEDYLYRLITFSFCIWGGGGLSANNFHFVRLFILYLFRFFLYLSLYEPYRFFGCAWEYIISNKIGLLLFHSHIELWFWFRLIMSWVWGWFEAAVKLWLR